MAFKKVINDLSQLNANIKQLTEKENEELKSVLLDAYLEIQEMCGENGINIMLVGGSALGAVRHKGYIPWDDDLDVAMPRRDYEKFKLLFDEKLGDKYVLDAPNYSENATDRFARILIKDTVLVEIGMQENEKSCIKIDLFIIENIPGKRVLRLLHGTKCTLLMFVAGQVGTYEHRNDVIRQYMSRTKEGKRIYNRRLRIGRVFSFFPASKWFEIVDRACQYGKRTKYMGIPTGRKHYFGEILPSAYFLPISKGLFEDKEVNLPHNVDAYLKNLFGNYMVIPKEKEREKHLISKVKFSTNEKEENK